MTEIRLDFDGDEYDTAASSMVEMHDARFSYAHKAANFHDRLASVLRQAGKQSAQISDLIDRIAELEAALAQMDEALGWYETRVSGLMGYPSQHRYASDLLKDQGAKARAARKGV